MSHSKNRKNGWAPTALSKAGLPVSSYAVVCFFS
jgi:hypothetical protein